MLSRKGRQVVRISVEKDIIQSKKNIITVSDMYKTVVLFSHLFDFGIFQTFALHSFHHSGICLTKDLAHNFVKFLEQV